jgi:glycosyltransferase involved in cell wall biosynthesis
VIQGVNSADWHPAPRDSVFAGRFAIFSGGKLEFRKGQDIVIAAFRRFRAKHPEALLVTAWQNVWPASMVGMDLGGHAAGLPKVTPDGRADIVGWLEKNGIPRTACIDVGLVANNAMPNIVRACDLAVFPNRAEGGTNLVAMECIAAGVPTICSMNTGQLDLRDWCTPLDEQGPVPDGCPLYKGTEGWGESDVLELVEAMERKYQAHKQSLGKAYVAREDAVDIAHEFIAKFDWQQKVIPSLLDVIEPAKSEAA